MGKLAGIPEAVSAQEVSREGQLEIASTRTAMNIDSKMLLGYTRSYQLSSPSLLCKCHAPLVVAWVRHDERALFRRFPEVCYMDFTANTTKEKRPLYHLCFKTSSGFGVCIAFRFMCMHLALSLSGLFICCIVIICTIINFII
jgi:hypothetical protein